MLGGHSWRRREPRRLPGQHPAAEVEVDLAAAQRYGLKPGDVRRAAAWLMAGEEAGDIFVGGKAYDVQLWSPPESRRQRDRSRRT